MVKVLCDGLGGTIKHEAARASLQRPLEGQIQTALPLYEWAKEAIPSIQFQHADMGEYETEEHLLQNRLEAAVTIVDTHLFHSYSDRQNQCVGGKALFLLP